jgi:hypothetical protein
MTIRVSRSLAENYLQELKKLEAISDWRREDDGSYSFKPCPSICQIKISEDAVAQYAGRFQVG